MELEEIESSARHPTRDEKTLDSHLHESSSQDTKRTKPGTKPFSFVQEKAGRVRKGSDRVDRIMEGDGIYDVFTIPRYPFIGRNGHRTY